MAVQQQQTTTNVTVDYMIILLLLFLRARVQPTLDPYTEAFL